MIFFCLRECKDLCTNVTISQIRHYKINSRYFCALEHCLSCRKIIQSQLKKNQVDYSPGSRIFIFLRLFTRMSVTSI